MPDSDLVAAAAPMARSIRQLLAAARLRHIADVLDRFEVPDDVNIITGNDITFFPRTAGDAAAIEQQLVAFGAEPLGTGRLANPSLAATSGEYQTWVYAAVEITVWPDPSIDVDPYGGGEVDA